MVNFHIKLLKKVFYLGIILSLLLVLILSGCIGGGDETPTPTPTPVPISFTIHYVQGGLTFASDDNAVNGTTGVYPDTITVDNAYWIGETEVTYELWAAVRNWSLSHNYNIGFGIQGNNGSGTDKQPVTHVSWRSSVAFCNALTEYYNEKNDTNYDCVYYTDSTYTTPFRTVSADQPNLNTTPGADDNLYIKAAATGNTDMANCIAKGFRLPTSNEWELAARYKNGTDWTPGNYASGAIGWIFDPNQNPAPPSFVNPDQSATIAVAVYNTGATAVVKSKNPNALGLYDMSGNVSEWCFDWHPSKVDSERMLRGGGWCDFPAQMQIGYMLASCPPGLVSSSYGFRIVRSQ